MNLASLYRDIIDTFRQWKRNQLLMSFMKGKISIKNFCHLVIFSFFEAMVFIDKSNIEPYIPPIITEYTNNLTDENIKKRDLSIFKCHRPISRSSTSNDFLNDDFDDS
jgi:hypothetical protein